jgi:CheY-like chemotaxis protein
MHLPPASAPVLGDRKRLIQVVANLLGNAVKYTPEEGKIVLRLQVNEDEISLKVIDDGIGMTDETVASIFDLFVQAERTPDRSQGGLGLGLALVKNLVSAHGGTVNAQSAGLGQGSTFEIRLPRLAVQPVPETNEKTPVVHADSAAEPLRILIVDDNIDAANILEMFLSLSGHKVSVEYLAADAIENAMNNAPQVCLLDIGLPDMDGYELALQLRTLPQTAESMLIALTGYSQEKDREKSLASGFDHHFVKPIDTSKLAQLLKQVSET